MSENSSPIRVVVVGAAGRMGLEVMRAVGGASDASLVAAVDRTEVGRPIRELAGPGLPDLVIEAKLGEVLDRGADVIVDFTHASAAPEHALSALQRGVAPIIGASGLAPVDLKAIMDLSAERGVPGILVPNFAIGAVLMMRFSEMAARWMPDCAIVEMHHDRKEDAPSGTALHTADVIAGTRPGPAPVRPPQHIKHEGARGAEVKGVNVHSVRLLGLVAHQRVMFGAPGEVLTISHDSLDRTSFMHGVLLAVRRVRSLPGFVVGLDKLMFD